VNDRVDTFVIPAKFITKLSDQQSTPRLNPMH
jgi:hypothetical protein